MADAVLSVAITGEIKDLQKTLGQGVKEVSNFVVGANGELLKFDKTLSVLERQLKSFQNGLKNTLDPSRISLLNSAIDQTKQKIEQTTKSINGAGFNGLTVGSNKAAFALQNLGRVAQDAPFGFIGIQNNLNPLLESFQQLRKESGSNVGALKALGQSLIGPAGIGIALSVVSAGILLYQEYTRKAAKEQEALSKQTEDYAKTLQKVNQVQLTGQQNAQEELITLDLLFKAATNVNLTQSQRLKAADQLQQQFPQTFKNYTDEQIILGKVGSAYDDLSKQILTNAKARAGIDVLTENAKQQLLLQTRINNAKAAESRLLNETKIAQEILQAGNVADTKEAQKKLLVTKLNNSLVEKGSEDITNIGFLQIQLNKLKKEDLGITKLINDEIKKGATLLDTTPDAVKKIIDEASKISRIKPISQDFLLDTFTLANLKEFDLKVKIKPVLEVENFFSDAELKIFEQLNDFNNKASEIINGGIADTFGGLASAIGNGLANGGNIAEQLGSVLLGSIGNIAIQLGQLAIGVGVGIEGIKTALKSLNPALAIGAGVALVALGSFVKSAAANIGQGGGQQGGYQVPRFATGVTGFGGGVAMVGERGPELVTLPTGSNVITNQNTNKLLSGVNSRNSTTIIPDVKISGQDILLVFNRASKFNGRR